MVVVAEEVGHSWIAEEDRAGVVAQQAKQGRDCDRRAEWHHYCAPCRGRRQRVEGWWRCKDHDCMKSAEGEV